MLHIKPIIKTVSLSIFLSSMITINSFAHSGRTDSSWGHKDNKNVSGLGSYHYHHGYPAHLHENGCPYDGQTLQPNLDSEINNIQESKYDIGYTDGYNGNNKNTSHSSNETYINGYNDGYQKLQSDKSESYSLGFNAGSNGAPDNNSYSNEILKITYKDGYDKGYKNYITQNKEIYKKQGISDADKFITPSTFSDNVNQIFIKEYLSAYENRQSQLKDETKTLGFEDSIKGFEYKSQGFSSHIQEDWYKEGYDSGIDKLNVELKNAYDKGYKNETYEVPTELKLATNIIEEEFNKGIEDKKIYITKTTILFIITSIIIISIIILLNKAYKNKRSSQDK